METKTLIPKLFLVFIVFFSLTLQGCSLSEMQKFAKEVKEKYQEIDSYDMNYKMTSYNTETGKISLYSEKRIVFKKPDKQVQIQLNDIPEHNIKAGDRDIFNGKKKWRYTVENNQAFFDRMPGGTNQSFLWESSCWTRLCCIWTIWTEQ